MQTAPTKTPDDRIARVQSHGKGVGPPTSEAVEQRAREIARIDGRSGDEINEADRALASREILNDLIALSSDEVRSDVASSRNPADVAVETGHKIEDMRPADEQRNREAEVREGVREAEHERMLEGRNTEKETGA